MTKHMCSVLRLIKCPFISILLDVMLLVLILWLKSFPDWLWGLRYNNNYFNANSNLHFVFKYLIAYIILTAYAL